MPGRHISPQGPTRPRHVLLTGNTAFKIANFRASLVRALIDEGCIVSTLTPQDGDAPRLAALGCRTHFVPIRRGARAPLHDLALLSRFHRTFARLSPDVILGFTIKNNIYGAFAARRLGIPFLPNVTGLGTAFHGGGPLNRVVVQLYRRAFAEVPAAFLQNPEDRQLFLDLGILRPRQARLLPGSGVDLATFAPAPLPPADAPVRFLMVSRMLRTKGVGTFVEAAGLLRARHPGLRFDLLGPLDPGNPDAIPRSRLEEWARAGNVRYLGGRTDVRPHVAAAACVVLPSFYREGTPRALLEAAAMARPVITTDTPGCRDTVEHGRTGYLCPPNDARALADAMLRLVSLPRTARQQMADAARQKAERQFDEGLVIDAYRQAIAEACPRA